MSRNFFSLFFWKRFTLCLTFSRCHNAARVLEVSSREYGEAQETRGMIVGESDGESKQTPRLRKMKKVSSREPRVARAQALTHQKLLPLLSASQTCVFEKYCSAREAGGRASLSIKVLLSVAESGHER